MISADEKKEGETIKNIDPIQHNGKSKPGKTGKAENTPQAENLEKTAPPKTEEEKNFSSTLKEMFVQVTEKGEKMVKTSAAAVGDFTLQAAHQAKLKLEIHNLKNNLEKRYQEVGEKLWQMQRRGEANHIAEAFADDFKRMAAIEETLKIKEDEAERKTEVPEKTDH